MRDPRQAFEAGLRVMGPSGLRAYFATFRVLGWMFGVAFLVVAPLHVWAAVQSGSALRMIGTTALLVAWALFWRLWMWGLERMRRRIVDRAAKADGSPDG